MTVSPLCANRLPVLAQKVGGDFGVGDLYLLAFPINFRAQHDESDALRSDADVLRQHRRQVLGRCLSLFRSGAARKPHS